MRAHAAPRRARRAGPRQERVPARQALRRLDHAASREELQLDTRDYEQGRVLQPITSFIAGHGRARREAPVHYDKIVSYGIRRCEFDNYLLQRCGARLRLGEAWESMERVGRPLARQRDRSARRWSSAPAGISVRSCAFLGANLGKGERAIAAQEIEFEMSDEQAAALRRRARSPGAVFLRRPERLRLVLPQGKFPERRAWAARAITGSPSTCMRSAAGCNRRARCLPMRRRASKDTRICCTRTRKRPVVGDGVLIIGDAAGLAYAESGEGIRPAIESGLMAAQIIAAARGDYSNVVQIPRARNLPAGCRAICAAAATTTRFSTP